MCHGEASRYLACRSLASTFHGGRAASTALWFAHHSAKLTAGGSSPLVPSAPTTSARGASAPSAAAPLVASADEISNCRAASSRTRRATGEPSDLAAGTRAPSVRSVARPPTGWLLSLRDETVSLPGESTAIGGGRTPSGAAPGLPLWLASRTSRTAAFICSIADSASEVEVGSVSPIASSGAPPATAPERRAWPGSSSSEM
mmetsp:Transcript_27187/g.82472  ORF Transcript_27187/g.82472 Transcript_27187/m.82472 type:complete len:202 (+) Transcript_27187:774-1379(+)|eukprot:scaffold25717_cov31-Tisochrysis_lutea.AAC.2